jgi:hypothetical protein
MIRIRRLAFFIAFAPLAACVGPDASPDQSGDDLDLGTFAHAAEQEPEAAAPVQTENQQRAGSTRNDVGYPAAHPAPPQVVSWGGPVMSAPKVVPVFFAGDDRDTVAALEDFEARVGSTEYWAATTKEYGVGQLGSLAPVELGEKARANLDDRDIQAWLAKKLNSNDPAFPAADDNTLYVLHYPAGATVSIGPDQSCVSFGGYHSHITLDAAHGNQHVPYAVIPRCGTFGALNGVDAVTGTISHELVEAATDPLPMTTPAYADVDDAHGFWSSVLGGGETGDMCAQFPGSFTRFAELPYVVQRSWSNRAALAGKDPCVPAMPGSVYFNSVPEMDDDMNVALQGQTSTVKGIRLQPGHSRTVDVDLFSEGDTGGAWTVAVRELGSGGKVGLALDRNQGQNGDKLHLTVSVKANAKHGSSAFIMTSKLGRTTNYWVGFVGY